MPPCHHLSLPYPGGASYRNDYNKETGLEWIKKVRLRYPHMVWLNPIAERRWAHTYGNSTIGLIRKEVPMFELSLSGLDAAIKKLLVTR